MEDGDSTHKCSPSAGCQGNSVSHIYSLIDRIYSMKLIPSPHNNNNNGNYVHSYNRMKLVSPPSLSPDDGDDERDWSGGMLKELVTKIAEHVEHFEDFETFFWVCSSWRSAAYGATFATACLYNNINNNKHNKTHTLPWLLLPKNDIDDYLSRCRFYSLSNRMFRCVYLPVHNNNAYRFLSSHGWLLLTLEGQGENICLFNPYTGHTIKPPPIKLSCPAHQGVPFVHSKFVLSANPSTTLEYVVFLALEDLSRIKVPSMLVFWRNGYDDGWIQVTEPPTPPGLPPLPRHLQCFHDSLCRDIVFYQGEFYGVNFCGLVVKFQTLQGKPHFQVITRLETGYEYYPHILLPSDADSRRFESNEKCFYYLVESKGQLLVIAQETWEGWDTDNLYHILCPRKFEVFELNVKSGTLKPVLSLGNRSIFTGLNSSYSMEVSLDDDHGFKPNCIYSTDDRVTWAWAGRGFGQIDACVYNLSHGMIERLYHGPSQFGLLTSFTWVESPHPSDEISFSQ